eukprot:NODE_10961_length_1317_cov_6.853782.p1 GENE.NODE_10961_length_1317_cov_6.853782~~NODE_10961_length_1317_cov_6.853782.p1  ORF type:complete len:390 (-),score=84.58 NODE_10961_length_1317_cov_6.853782:148-1248(-)
MAPPLAISMSGVGAAEARCRRCASGALVAYGTCSVAAARARRRWQQRCVAKPVAAGIPDSDGAGKASSPRPANLGVRPPASASAAPASAKSSPRPSVQSPRSAADVCSPPCPPPGPACSPLARVAVVVPFREQLPLQDRRAQLERFLPHMKAFLSSIRGCKAVIIVVEQSQDKQKFNRGQLLNIGLRLAKEVLPGLTSFIMHDVDLLPSMEMRGVYSTPPPSGRAVHLASVWEKYDYPTFIGGVLAFQPEDFERVNGYPNDYWGWGLEDDQLALRMSNCSIGVLRVRAGSFLDIDTKNMKSILQSGNHDSVKRHLPWFNIGLFQRGELPLDTDWAENGLRNLRYKVIRSSASDAVHHSVVELLAPA